MIQHYVCKLITTSCLNDIKSLSFFPPIHLAVVGFINYFNKINKEKMNCNMCETRQITPFITNKEVDKFVFLFCCPKIIYSLIH